MITNLRDFLFVYLFLTSAMNDRISQITLFCAIISRMDSMLLAAASLLIRSKANKIKTSVKFHMTPGIFVGYLPGGAVTSHTHKLIGVEGV